MSLHGSCGNCGKYLHSDATLGYCQRTPECWRFYRLALKQLTMEAYGDGRCACCGETYLLFLTLDHIAGDGAAYRKANKYHAGAVLYHHLRKRGWPDKDRYQVLCSNCNTAKNVAGKCPCRGGVRPSPFPV